PTLFRSQVDVDVAKLGYQRRIDLGVLGDAAITAKAVLAELSKHQGTITNTGWRNDKTRQRIPAGDNHNSGYLGVSTARTIDPRTISKAMDEMLPTERVVVTDAGHFQGWPALYLRVPDERGWSFTQSFQSIGLGLATAIGAGIAQADRLVVLGAGDGGFMMSIADLE